MLPAAAAIKKQGANNGATTAFLISTPESGVDSIAITYALLDPIMTVVRPLAAFVTAMVGGCLENSISYKTLAPAPLPLFVAEPQEEQSENCKERCCSEKSTQETLPHKLVAGLRYALIDVWGDIALWFFAGVILAGAITALLPVNTIDTWLGGGLHAMLIMLIVGVPLYICATASTPIAAALILKGVSPGAALVFLLVGPATNVTSLSVLVKILGKNGTTRYLLSVASMAVLFGLGVDALYNYLAISPQAVIGQAAELVPLQLQVICSLLLVGLSVKPLLIYLKRPHRF